jgi:DNA-3-methyladenine glycosylase
VPQRLIPREFYLRPVVEVARDLLGRHLRHFDVVLRITEVEAYAGQDDTASHCRSGRTPRNAPMWEEGGRAYVYFCYGMHHMLNIVTGPAGDGSAILIRGCEPVAGLELVRRRRCGPGGQAPTGPALLTGPGKVAQALGVDLSFTRHLLYREGGLELREGTPPAGVLSGPRVGVDFASDLDRARPWRFALAGSLWVSQPRGLAPDLTGAANDGQPAATGPAAPGTRPR